MNIKVKVIGAGSIGNHLTQAARRMGWQVVVVDRDPVALERMKIDIYPKRYGAWDESIQLFTTEQEPKDGFDIICLGTPPDVRMKLALAALSERPKILQLEKPLCTPSLAGLEDFLAAYKIQTDTIAVIGYDHAVSRSIFEVLSLIQQGIIGSIQTLDVEFREHWQGIFSAHPWLKGPEDTYLGYWQRGGGAGGEHSHALHLWQLLARHSGFGAWVKVGSAMEKRQLNGAEHDILTAFNFITESGKVGRVVQDVITYPTRKWARLQGENGFIEWIANGSPEGDVVRYKIAGQEVVEKVFAKKRPDDFYQEMLHIQDILDKKVIANDSPISFESGLAVMKILQAVYAQPNETLVLA